MCWLLVSCNNGKLDSFSEDDNSLVMHTIELHHNSLLNLHQYYFVEYNCYLPRPWDYVQTCLLPRTSILSILLNISLNRYTLSFISFRYHLVTSVIPPLNALICCFLSDPTSLLMQGSLTLERYPVCQLT